MTNLHDELTRIADAAPPVHVPDDVWEQGRRARTRDRLLGAGAVVVAVAAVLALVVGLGGWLRPGVAPVPPADDGPGAPGVPSRIWPVPERLIDWREDLAGWSADVAETDLAVGRAAVAFTAGPIDEHPVVVTADDGDYHPLTLPGWIGAGMINVQMSDDNALALSPDGRSLAYAWWDPEAPLDRPMPAGVRVVDVETGHVRSVALHGGNGVLVHSLVWSTDSRWLGWAGLRTRSWTPHSMGGGSTVAGVIGPRARHSRPVAGGRIVALGAGGQPLLLERNGRLRMADGTRLAIDSTTATTGVTSPDGSAVLLGSASPSDTVTIVAPDTGETDLIRLDAGAYPEGALVDPLGWIDGEHAATMLTRASDVEPHGGFTWREQEVAIIDRTTGSVTPVSSLEATFTHAFTVATDLMTLDRPTVERDRPDWPGIDAADTPWLQAIGGGVALGVALAAYVVWRRRRS